MSEKGFWGKIKAGIAVLLAGLSIAIPTVKYAKDRNTKTLDKGEEIIEKDTNVNKDGGFVENEDGSLTPIKNEETSEFKDSIKVEPVTEKPAYSGLTYNDLLKQLNDVMDKKGYGDLEYRYIKLLFDNVYNNYDYWKDIRKDWPSKNYFISENFIKSLDSCNLHFVEKNRDKKEWKELDKQGSARAFTDSSFNVTIMCDEKEENENEDALRSVLEDILHELGHITQKKVLFKDHFESYSFLLEGWPTVLMDIANKPKTEKTSSDYIPLGAENITINYEGDDGEGYPLNGNLTNQLIYLVGYDTVESVMKGAPIEIIDKKLSEKYGSKKAKKIKELLETIDSIRNIDSDSLAKGYADECNSTVELENEILDCIGQDISSLKTMQEIEEYINIYRAYIINLLPRVYKDISTDVTEQYFPKVKELNKKMAKKIHESGAFGLKNLSSAEALVGSTSIERINEDGWTYLPVNLKQTQFLETSDGLYLCYLDETAWGESYVCILINDNTKEILELDNEPEGVKPFYDAQEQER